MFVKKVKYFILSIICMIVIFSFSSQVANESNQNNYFVLTIFYNNLKVGMVKPMDYNVLNFLIRKTAHVTEYFILFMLLYYAFKKSKLKKEKLKAAVITILYACTDEFHQLFVPGREGKITDVFVDSIGVVIGLIIIYLYKIYSDK